MLTPPTLTRIRQIALGATGVACLSYAVLALALGRPDPMPGWIPGAFGILAGVIITATHLLAGKRAARAANDELQRAENRRALAISYWVALALYPLFGLLLALGYLTYPTAFAAMGTLTGAAYLLLTTAFDLRG